MDVYRFRPYAVADPDINLKRDPDVPQPGQELNAKSVVFGLVADRLDNHVFHIEGQSVRRHFQTADFREDSPEPGFRKVADSQEIKVHRLARKIAGPYHEQHGAFYDKALGVVGFPKPIEPTFERVSSQDRREIVSPRRVEVKQSLMNRLWEIRYRILGHDRASI